MKRLNASRGIHVALALVAMMTAMFAGNAIAKDDKEPDKEFKGHDKDKKEKDGKDVHVKEVVPDKDRPGKPGFGGHFNIKIHPKDDPKDPPVHVDVKHFDEPRKGHDRPSPYDIFRKMSKPPWMVEPVPIKRFEVLPPPPKHEPLYLLEFAGLYFPYCAAQLHVWREHYPDVYAERLHELEVTVREFAELREHSPERARLFLRARSLEDRSRQLADAIVNSYSMRDRMKLQRELSEVLETSFEVQTQLHLAEIDELERQITEISATVERRRRYRERIIDRRQRELLQEAGQPEVEEEIPGW